MFILDMGYDSARILQAYESKDIVLHRYKTEEKISSRLGMKEVDVPDW